MIAVRRANLDAVHQMRDAYRRAVGAQIVHDSWHHRGFTTLHLLEADSQVVGYGAVGGPPGQPHETVKEFYLVPAAVPDAARHFVAFLATTRPRWLEAQTNDPFLAPLLSRFAPGHGPHTNLFADSHETGLTAPEVRLRPVTPQDHATVFAHTTEPIGDWGLDHAGALVATGGLLFHYNPPYGDLYMEVAPLHRRRGYASYLLQELKRICYETGHIPAARCHMDNVASRRALERAGMRICGCIVRGPIAT